MMPRESPASGAAASGNAAAAGKNGLEFRLLTPDLGPALAEFFAALAHGPEPDFFHPHPMTADEARRICEHAGRDLYYAACLSGRVVGYGLLRGWDEGYAIPSLGIAIHPEARGQRLARPFMVFLHAAARVRGANKIRLTVYASNQRAVALYQSLGYVLEPKNDRELVGFLDL
jgi:ribosomal-protein-alanine N-acetyltransferase